MCETCSKLTIKTPERGQWCRSGVLLWTDFTHWSGVSIVGFEQVNAELADLQFPYIRMEHAQEKTNQEEIIKGLLSNVASQRQRAEKVEVRS